MPVLARVRRIALIGLLFLLAAAIAGALYQTVSVRREAARFPAPGRLVDVGGRRLHLLCIGEGNPTVVFESSGFGNSVSSQRARTAISTQTRVCSYDRMGTGWSDPGPRTISVGLLADDLKTLLDRAGIAPPYLFVAASIGGLTVEMFARRYPDRVAGLVFLDAATSDTAILDRVGHLGWLQVRAACLTAPAARVGLLRALDPFHLRGESSPGAARSAALLYRPEPMASLCAFAKGVDISLRELKSAPPLPADVPLLVLIAEFREDLMPAALRSWRDPANDSLLTEAQVRFAKQSARGTSRVVPQSKHLIAGSHPQVVADAVLEMLASIRGARL